MRISEQAGPFGLLFAATTAIASITPLLQVPQSISVVTRGQLDAGNVETDSEALLYTPGVSTQPFGASFDQLNPFYYIRGFPTAAGGSYVDYLASPVNYRYEPYGFDRYDILRGLTSVLYGPSDRGGNLLDPRAGMPEDV